MMIRTQLLLPEELLANLRALAVAQKTSVSSIARQKLAKDLPALIKKRPAAEVMLEMAKHAYKGKVPKDFSTNDDYLYKLP
ncbi:MAG: hypothetical protein AAB492_03785 [Patescibacteria group bacterium]